MSSMKYAWLILPLLVLAGGGCKWTTAKKASVETDVNTQTRVEQNGGSSIVSEPSAAPSRTENTPSATQGEAVIQINTPGAGVNVGVKTNTSAPGSAQPSQPISSSPVPAPAPAPKPAPAPAPALPTVRVVINGRQLTEAQLEEFAKQYGQKPAEGSYWYDSKSGFYGSAGGPTAGVMNSGHAYGSVSANASNGDSGVFINGRQLQMSEALGLAALFGAAPPGRYWMDESGNIGVEGTDYPIANFYLALASAYSSGGRGGGGGSGDNFWSSRFSAGNYYTDSSGAPSQGYVSVPGYGPVGYGF